MLELFNDKNQNEEVRQRNLDVFYSDDSEELSTKEPDTNEAPKKRKSLQEGRKPKTYLTNEMVVNIGNDFMRGAKTRTLIKKYDISRPTLYRIIKNLKANGLKLQPKNKLEKINWKAAAKKVTQLRNV